MSSIAYAVFLLLSLGHFVKGQLECNGVITINTRAGNDTEGCLVGEYPCSSLDYTLSNLQSNDCVNITSNSVSLSTVVELNNIDAIIITGNGNTTIICYNSSRMTCKNCSNVVIRGLTWNGCGDSENIVNGVINLERIANLSIQDCKFQFSKSRALTVWTVSGLIELVDTQVINNANYDIIHCHPDNSGVFRCATENCDVTGGVRIQESLTEASIRIANCIFEHNGYFGEVINTEKKSNVPYGCEIADGVGLLFNNINENEVNLLIENSTFSSNRGRSGAGAFIKTINSSSITLVNTTFRNNSVINFRINSSAFLVFTNHQKILPFVPLLHLSMCKFYNNNEGRNMIGYTIEGASPVRLLIENCYCESNSKYDITMIELNMHSSNT